MFSFSLTSALFWFGIIIVIFIISVSLMIFAPHSVNYFDENTYPELQTISKQHLTTLEYELDCANKPDELGNWMRWPDSKYIKGNCKLYPLYMFSTLSHKRKMICPTTFKLLQRIPNVKTCSFAKIEVNSSIENHKEWKDLCNKTLRCLIIISSPNASVENCGIWVNGESKKLHTGDLIVMDGCKEHSIYNKSDLSLSMLLVDIDRPESIPVGSSDRVYSDEIQGFVHELNREPIKQFKTKSSNDKSLNYIDVSKLLAVKK
jgi:aspartyl/asparaginyl beta-hydroxylase (cupin superfamily)